MKVGDVVIYTCAGPWKNRFAIIRTATTRLGIEFCETVDGGHNLGGAIISNNGYWVSAEHLIPAEPVADVIRKLFLEY